jgi:hypothetical protein
MGGIASSGIPVLAVLTVVVAVVRGLRASSRRILPGCNRCIHPRQVATSATVERRAMAATSAILASAKYHLSSVRAVCREMARNRGSMLV